MKKFFLPAVMLLLAACNNPQQSITITSKGFSLQLNKQGAIEKLIFDNGNSKAFTAATHLKDCIVKTSSFENEDRQIIFHRQATDTVQHKSCNITETFTSTANSIRWKVAIAGITDDWTTSISTALHYGAADSALFWTTWGAPEQTQPAETVDKRISDWSNPFRAMPFRNMHLLYGGHFNLGGGYSVPIVSIFDTSLNKGISLAMSPENNLFDLQLETSATGDIIQTRKYHRISKKQPVILEMDILVAEPDWRASMNWMLQRYPDFFNPKNPNAGEVSGLGAYSAYEGDVDTAKYKKMGGIVNWKASFDFPYMGMFIPPVTSDTAKWQRYDVTSDGEHFTGNKTYTSIDQMRRYDSRMNEFGFKTLSYFNVTEFGGMSPYSDTMIFPMTTATGTGDNAHLDPSAFLSRNFPNAVLFNSFGTNEWGWGMGAKEILDPPAEFVQVPTRTWGKAIVMDCGDSAYANFLLDQVKTHIDKLPHSSGICIDRTDWLWQYNWHADDGVSMIGSKPVRSLTSSWKSLMPRVGKLLHGSDKVIFCNPLINRLDLVNEVDGFYNEYGQVGFNVNLTAFLALKKPLLAWTPSAETVLSNPNKYFQQLLFMGAFPTAPYPKNDHTINPGPAVEKWYLEYGALFNQLHGREAVLVAGVVQDADDKALVNIFKTGETFSIPVIAGRMDTAHLIVKLTNEMKAWKNISAKVILPGTASPVIVSAKQQNGSLLLSIPLKRGCAMLVLGD